MRGPAFLRSLLAGSALLCWLIPAVASAQLMLTGAGSGNGAAAGGGGGFALTYRGNVNDETDLTTYSFTGKAIGTASADRVCILAFYGNASGNQSISSVSVNSGAATATQVISEAASTRHLEIWTVPVPTGTTMDVAPTYSGTMQRAGMLWWCVTGTTQAAYSSRSNSGSTSTSSSATQLASTATVPAGGAGLAVAINNQPTEAITWSQTSGSGTNRYDANNTGVRVSGYDTTTAGAQTFTAIGGPTTGVWRTLSITWAP